MRSALTFAAVFCFSVSLAAASDRPDASRRVEGCTDDGCGVAYYKDSSLCEAVPLPRREGPHRCVPVPDRKETKKTVYETKWVPYCLTNPTCGECRAGDCDRPCPSCEKCVRWKKVVVKREVVAKVACGYKCVPQACGPGCGPTATQVRDAPPAPTPVPTAPPALRP